MLKLNSKYDSNGQRWVKNDSYLTLNCAGEDHHFFSFRYDASVQYKIHDVVLIEEDIYQVCLIDKVEGGPIDGPYFLLYAHMYREIDPTSSEEWENIYGK